MAAPELPPRFNVPTMQRIETAWRPPWIVISSSQQGSRHYDRGENCQDSHAVGGHNDITWLVIADGVSSAAFGELASAEACHAVHYFLGRSFVGGEAPSKELVSKAIGVAHSRLQDIARSARRHIDDYATTLALALIQNNTIFAGAIGDSSVAVSSTARDYDNAELRHFTPFCTPTQSGERGILDLTHPKWQEFIALSESHNPQVDLLFLATDGGHNFFLSPKGTGHVFDDSYPLYLLKHLTNPKIGPLLIGNVLAKYMQEVPAEGHDDRTILVAARVPHNLIPPAQNAE